MDSVITGIGLEVFVWILLQSWNDDTSLRKNAIREYWWRFAQFLFPVMLTTATGLSSTRNYIALPILILGLWKFGFPETINHLYLAMYNDNASHVERFTEFLNGVGSVTHHSSAALVLVGVLTGVTSLDRNVMLPALILTTQHWFVLLFYANIWLYTIFTLVWEFWFEWVLLSNLESLRSSHSLVGIASCVMLLAHWLYLLAGALNLAGGSSNENVHVKAISHFQGGSTKKALDTQETTSETGEDDSDEESSYIERVY